MRNEVIIITHFSDIAESVKSHPYQLQAAMITLFEDCERCKVGNTVFEEYAAATEGIVVTYMVDCSKVWNDAADRERIPSCNPKLKHELPHVTFF